jgi:hypothetical protein
MTSIVLTVPLCLTGSLLSMVSIILLPATNLSLISTKDRASNKNMLLLITFVFAIEKQSLIIICKHLSQRHIYTLCTSMSFVTEYFINTKPLPKLRKGSCPKPLNFFLCPKPLNLIAKLNILNRIQCENVNTGNYVRK